jgi:hypothetical protein
MNSEQTNEQYKVLSPWADVDPVPLKGISPRVADLAGKKIGLLSNRKPAAGPILTVVEKKLKERYPTIETSWYEALKISVPQIETEDKDVFEKWVKNSDAIVTAVGD